MKHRSIYDVASDIYWNTNEADFTALSQQDKAAVIGQLIREDGDFSDLEWLSETSAGGQLQKVVASAVAGEANVIEDTIIACAEEWYMEEAAKIYEDLVSIISESKEEDGWEL